MDVCKTEIMGSVTVKVFYKHFDKAYRYFVDVNSMNPHQKSWSRQILESNNAPDGEMLAYCFFIHLKVIKHIQKHLKKKTSNLLRKVQYKKMYDAQDGRCYLCNDEMHVYDCTIEHVVPLSLGGKDKLSNKLLAHGRCNAEKANRMPTKNELSYLQEVHNKMRGIDYYKIIV